MTAAVVLVVRRQWRGTRVVSRWYRTEFRCASTPFLLHHSVTWRSPCLRSWWLYRCSILPQSLLRIAHISSQHHFDGQYRPSFLFGVWIRPKKLRGQIFELPSFSNTASAFVLNALYNVPYLVRPAYTRLRTRSERVLGRGLSGVPDSQLTGGGA